MTRLSLRVASVLVFMVALAVPAMAQTYVRVDTSAPQINCLFSTTCSVVVNDMVSTMANGGRVQSRTFQGQPGSTLAGKWVYLYRVDMSNAVGVLSIPYVTRMSISGWGPLVNWDYNFDWNYSDQVYTVTQGAIGTVGLSDAFNFWGTSFFYFDGAVYGGGSPGTGESSRFFGLVSNYPPIVKNATVTTDAGSVTVSVKAPQVP
jgi:hypothetical protein